MVGPNQACGNLQHLYQALSSLSRLEPLDMILPTREQSLHIERKSPKPHILETCVVSMSMREGEINVTQASNMLMKFGSAKQPRFKAHMDRYHLICIM